MSELHEEIREIEAALYELRTNPSRLPEARRTIAYSLQKLANIECDEALPLPQTFEVILRNRGEHPNRDLGLVSIRLTACSEILSASEIRDGRRHIVHLIEVCCPDLIKQALQAKDAQNHEKFTAAQSIHDGAMERLGHLTEEFNSLDDLRGRRQLIMRALNHGPTKSYLSPFGFTACQSSVTSLLKRVDDLSHCQNQELQTGMQRLLESITDELAQYDAVTTLIAQDYMLPFLRRAEVVAKADQDAMARKFVCNIGVPKSPYELEKRYPLHVAGSLIQFEIPVVNEGPGVAEDVRVTCLADNCEVQSDEASLGDVVPGPFVLPVLVKVTEGRAALELVLEIEWGVVGRAARSAATFSVVARGQRTDVKWEDLALREPYSLEVVHEGDFYGRKDAVRRILRRLGPDSMQSCYITGQKRVGKSSLARVVEAQINKNAHEGEYHVLYLECGEIRYSTGAGTLEELGLRLETFLTDGLPRSVQWSQKDYASSLTPLNSLLELLRRERPTYRFVVILDEFDEINEDLYRSGELANAFFLNLRTLSSKRNLAFLLVGAERMPYVMASQGEKLNKFGHESLNSFNLDTEWSDYRAMIETPLGGDIKLHHAALRNIFDVTDGHPYFTKVLCAKIYEGAVEAKDAEVSTAEVEHAARRVIETLDINAFAHYWRDGIRGSSEDVEIVSVKRCRVLVAWARAARAKRTLTHDAIQEQLHSNAMTVADVLPVLHDFCRRGILHEEEKSYRPTVTLFGEWLKEVGFARLLNDQLGDELANARQEREDAAYVRASEIGELVRQWGLYQGRRITAEDVRAWLEQVESHVEQRLLFKLLQNVRFVTEVQAREAFDGAHKWIRTRLPVVIQKRRAQQRDDILVSYADGPTKSGAYYAALYANVNGIGSRHVAAAGEIAQRIREMGRETVRGLIIVDDVIGTGGTLVEQLQSLSGTLEQANVGKEVPLLVVVLCGTGKGEERVRRYLTDAMPNANVFVCENVEERHFAFGDALDFWETEDEKMEAKALVRDLGARVQKRSPLGFGEQGLLLTFWRNCPNNSVPILYGSGKGDQGWCPLFPRANN